MPELPEVGDDGPRLAPGAEGAPDRARRGAPRRSASSDPGRSGAAVDRRDVSPGFGRRAKYGLIETDRGDTLVFHLGMSGDGESIRRSSDKHDHFIIETEEGRRSR